MDDRNLWDRFWKDKKGRVVIWQSPNPPLYLWLVFLVVSRIIKTGTVHDGAGFVSTAFLLIWAYLELTEGASYFRRAVGLTVFVSVVVAKIH